MKLKLQPIRRSLVFLLMIALVLPLFGSFGAIAAGQPAPPPDSTTRQKKKVVSVVFDDSGSMCTNIVANSESFAGLDPDDRFYYARYAVQMLISLLNDNDELVIVPMSSVGDYPTGKPIYVSFSDQNMPLDRNAVIEATMEHEDEKDYDAQPSHFLFKSDPGSNTPIASVDDAIEQLKKKGMKKSQDIVTSEDDTEYWLVVLTDGVFGSVNGVSYGEVANLENAFIQKTQGYYGLRTVYVVFGNPKLVVDLSGDPETRISNQAAPFSAYAATDDIADVMQQVAAKITGRYQSDSGNVTAVENKLTIAVPDNYTVNSVSVIVQDVEVVNPKQDVQISYSEGTLKAEQACAMDAYNITTIAGAYSVVLRPAPETPLRDGEITLEFPEGVDLQNATCTVLFEPSVRIEPYIIYEDNAEIKQQDGTTVIQKGDEISTGMVNAYLTGGKKISVGYRAYDEKTNAEIKLSQVFGNGKITDSVTYNGSSYNVGEAFPVQTGKSEIVVSVAANKGEQNEYVLYGSLFCNIEENPSLFRIEYKKQDISPTEYRVDFTVYYDSYHGQNNKVNIEDLPARHLEYQIFAEDGSGAKIPLKSTGKEGGNAYAILDIAGKRPDAYSITMVLMSDQTTQDEQYRITTCRISPGTKIEGAFVEGTGGRPDQVDFTMLINNAPAGNLFGPDEWNIELRDSYGAELTEFDKATDGSLSVQMREKLPYGKYTASIRVGSLRGTANFSVFPKALVINVTSPDLGAIRQFALNENTKEVKFELTDDGKPINFDTPILTYKVTFGDEDVTEYATVAGNTLTYVPKAAHIRESYRSPGEKKITLSVTCNGNTETKIVTFQLEKTQFQLETVQLLNQDVDRFNINKSGAGIYFRLSRDGISVSEEELHEFYESGQLSVKLPFALSFFLLPAGADVGIEMVDGEPLLYCKVVKDQIGIFSVFTSMLLFNGEKTVTATYKEATYSEAVIFKASPIFQYVWRLLLLAFIIYVIIYIIGFFTGKMIPRGLLVTVSIGTNDSVAAKVTIVKVNMSIGNAVWWHFKRFFIGPLRNQTPITLPDGGVISRSKTGTVMLKNEFNYAKAVSFETTTTDGLDFVRFVKSLPAKNIDSISDDSVKIRDEQTKEYYSKATIRGLFRDKSPVKIIGRGEQIPLIDRAYYELFSKLPREGEENEPPISSTIVFYIKRRR